MSQQPPDQPPKSGVWNYRWQDPPPPQAPYPAGQQPVYQQPYQQPPLYPQPLYQQPMRPQPSVQKAKQWPWIVAIFIVFFFGVGVGRASAPSASDTVNSASTANTGAPASTQPTTPAVQATSAPTQAQHFKVGQTVQVGNTWKLMVNSVKESQGDAMDTPNAGDVYLLIDVSMQNISASEQDASSLIMWTLRDSTGQEYTETITTFAPSTPDGKVEAGSALRGTLAYEVPASMHTYTLAFQGDFLSSGQTIWDISV